jgi:hypothetical protein
MPRDGRGLVTSSEPSPLLVSPHPISQTKPVLPVLPYCRTARTPIKPVCARAPRTSRTIYDEDQDLDLVKPIGQPLLPSQEERARAHGHRAENEACRVGTDAGSLGAGLGGGR